MPESVIIDINNKLSAAEDYNFLRKEGIRLIQELSGKVWTDYNTHDPGITLLEAICYALTDLGYRTSFDLKDILAVKEPGLFNWENIFYTARQILPCHPVTLTDYRKVIIDVEGVRNAWIEMSDDYEMKMHLHREGDPEDAIKDVYTLTYEPEKGDDLLPLRGLYKVFVEFEEEVIQDEKQEDIVRKIKERLFANRNLCEDFISVSSVEYEYFHIEAEIQVSEGADIEKVNARIYEVLYEFFSPPITFYSLEQMLERGCSAADIFEGPLLDHGFIDTKELEKSERFKNVNLSDIISLVSRIEGVIAVKKFTFPTETNTAFGNFSQWIINVKDRKKAPRLNIDDSVLTFVRSGDRHRSEEEKVPNKNRVHAIFLFLQASKFTSKLKKTASDFPVPAGEFMDISDYYPFQKSLPAVYGMAESYLDKRIDEVAIRQAANAFLEEKVGFKIRRLLEELLAEVTDQPTLIKVIEALSDPQTDPEAVDEILNSYFHNLSEDLALKNIGRQVGIKVRDQDTLEKLVQNLLEEHRRHPVAVSAKAKLLQKIAAEVSDLPLWQVSSAEDLNKINDAYKKNQLGQLSTNKKLVLQLRGFLMVFEQLLADYLSTLAHVNELFSFDPQVEQMYFPQPLAGVQDLEALFIDYQKYASGLQELTETKALFSSRRNAMLDHLMGRFSEEMNKYSFFLRNASGREAERTLITDKVNFLADYVQISAGRGKGFDFSKAEEIWETNNVSGLKKRICRLLGLKNYRTGHIASDAIYIERVLVDDQIERYVVVLKDPLDKQAVLLRSEEYEFESEAREIQNYMLHHGAEEHLYEKSGRRDKWTYQLMRPDQEKGFEPVASRQFKSEEEFDAAFERTVQILAGFSQDENFHVIEHILLRPKVPPRGKTYKKNYSALDADVVDFLSVPDLSDKKDLDLNNQEDVSYKFKMVPTTDEQQRDKTNWHLSLVNEADEEVLVVAEVFSLYVHLHRRIAQIRQFGADSSNYAIAQDADGYFSFSIRDGARDLAVGSKNYRLKESLDQEITSLVNYFSYEGGRAINKEVNYDDIVYYADPYSFQVSIIIPDWPAKFRNLSFKHMLEKTIYLETPAHIYPQIYWLDHRDMRQLEEAYRLWLEEVAQTDIPNTEIVNNLISKINELRR
jgi:hypothetical protein